MYIQEELLEETDNIINADIISHRAKQSWFGVPKWVTEYDLKKLTGFEQSGQALLDCLYELGIDSKNCAVIEQTCLQRPDFFPTTGVHKGKRWIGIERIDNKWLYSGFASDEVRYSRSGFRDLADVLSEMGKQSNFTGELLEHMRNKGNVTGKKDGKVASKGGST
jgi:hypothetical protein